jgi:ribonuclease R
LAKDSDEDQKRRPRRQRTQKAGAGARRSRPKPIRRNGSRSADSGKGRGRSGDAGNRRSKSTDRPPAAGLEAIVYKAETPGSAGQIVLAKDSEGASWQIECLGEPVETGARIAFLALPALGERCGVMVRLLDAARSNWVCTLRRGPSGLWLVPFGGAEAPNMTISDADSKGAPDGSRVLVMERARVDRSSHREKSRQRGSRPGAISVRVIEALGMPFEPDGDHRAVVWKHRLTTEFSRRARLEVADFQDALSPKVLDQRLDLRHQPFLTIDPASARDHDDAIFAERRAGPSLQLGSDGAPVSSSESRGIETGWTHRLWVAIADVSHFVSAGGWVDAEARRRGNSFYFPDRSIPMLPERLSSDLCSLRVGVDRLALVVELRIDATGSVVDSFFHEAVIRSCAGLSYEEAAGWLAVEPEARPTTGGDLPEWGDSLLCLQEIAEMLSVARLAAGSLSLELPEVEIEVNESGRPVDAHLRISNPAHGLIEEAMLAANRAVARQLEAADRLAVHRSHPPPSPQKLAGLLVLLERLGIEPGGDLTAPGILAKLLLAVKGEPAEEQIHRAVLRSMSQARYEPESKGHYALQFKHYLHFTSPIRRYADLEVHRVLKELIRGEATNSERNSPIPASTARLAIWLSGRERVATEVEREADALACCALMTGREGAIFEATVTGATEFGIFIRLDSPAVGGLVPLRLLKGTWVYDPEQEALLGEGSRHRIVLGDRLWVELVAVDGDKARMTFRLARKPGRKRAGT